MPTFVKYNAIHIDLKAGLGWTDPDRYPDAVDVYHEGYYDNFVTYLPERTCRIVRENVDIDGTRMTDYSCGCFNNEGWNHNYCPNCGARIVD